MNRSIGENIRRVRITKGLSQQQLANSMSVERSTVAGWESGRRIPDVDMLVRVAKALNVPITSLIDKKDREKSLVMILDDEEVILNFNQSILKQVLQNTDIVCFTKPSEAINYAKANTVNLDLIEQIIQEGAISDANLRLLVDSIVISEKDKKLHIKINLNAKFDCHKDCYDAEGNLTERMFIA